MLFIQTHGVLIVNSSRNIHSWCFCCLLLCLVVLGRETDNCSINFFSSFKKYKPGSSVVVLNERVLGIMLLDLLVWSCWRDTGDRSQHFRACMKTTCTVKCSSSGCYGSHLEKQGQLYCTCFKIKVKRHFKKLIFRNLSRTRRLGHFVSFTDSKVWKNFSSKLSIYSS